MPRAMTVGRMSVLLAVCAALSACASHRPKSDVPPPSLHPELAFGQTPADAAFSERMYACKEALSTGRTLGGGTRCK